MNDAGNQSPTAPVGASPSPPQPSPGAQQGTAVIIQVVQLLRGLAKSNPAAAPIVMKINDLMRELSATMMQNQVPGEPQAGPTGG